MKRLFALLLVFCLLPLTALGASSPVLPDFGAFANQALELTDTVEKDYLIERTYVGPADLVASLAEAYVALLEDSYNMRLRASFLAKYSSNDEAMIYTLNYKGSSSMGTFNAFNESYPWRCNDCQVFLFYPIPSSGEASLLLWYRPEFDFCDTGDRADGSAAAVPAEKPASKATAKPTDKPHSTRCSTCGGDGQVERNCANCGGDGKRDCMSCAGKGYNNCSGCGGTGSRRCGSCYGTGTSNGKRCSTCHGSGRRDCSSCSSGKKTCSACSGSGDRRCTSCSGTGKKSSTCSSCGGDGVR